MATEVDALGVRVGVAHSSPVFGRNSEFTNEPIVQTILINAFPLV